MIITLDIETRRADPYNPLYLSMLDTAINKIKAPGNYKKPEAVRAYIETETVKTVREFWEKSSLNPNLGSIACIGLAVDSKPVEIITTEKQTERELLSQFWDIMSAGAWTDIIGHNILGFEAEWIWKRSIINGIKPGSFKPSHTSGYMNQSNIYDTMVVWGGKNRSMISLDNLAKILGLGSKEGQSGARVHVMIEAGAWDKLAEYCANDVELTRDIFYRLNQ